MSGSDLVTATPIPKLLFAIACVCLLVSCDSAKVIVDEKSPQHNLAYQLAFKRGEAVDETTEWVVYIKFHSDGSAFISDDETGLSLILILPKDDSSVEKESPYAFFSRYVYGNSASGYASVQIEKFEVTKDILRLDCRLTGTIVESKQPDFQIRAEIVSAEIPIEKFVDPENIISLNSLRFAEYFEKKFNKKWEGPLAPPPL